MAKEVFNIYCAFPPTGKQIFPLLRKYYIMSANSVSGKQDKAFLSLPHL